MIIMPLLIFLSPPAGLTPASGHGAMIIRNHIGETPPVCEKVLVEENSTNGPNYYVTLCGDRRLPIHVIIVDGSKLPERSEIGTRPHNVLFWYPRQ